jgi:hypothetical protein
MGVRVLACLLVLILASGHLTKKAYAQVSLPEPGHFWVMALMNKSWGLVVPKDDY